MTAETKPDPAIIPKLYFLDDTGAGRTAIARKIFGTEESKFPLVKEKQYQEEVAAFSLLERW